MVIVVAKPADVLGRGEEAGESHETAKGRSWPGEAQAIERVIIPRPRDRGFKSRPRNQLSTNSVRAFRGPDLLGLFHGGDKMVTTAAVVW